MIFGTFRGAWGSGFRDGLGTFRCQKARARACGIVADGAHASAVEDCCRLRRLWYQGAFRLRSFEERSKVLQDHQGSQHVPWQIVRRGVGRGKKKPP